MRLRQRQDDPDLTAMLGAEGLKLEEMAFADHATWVLEREGRAAGFFTIRREHKMPYVLHFCTSRGPNGRRRWGDALRLARWVPRVLRSMGARKAILNVPADRPCLARAVKKIWGARKYATNDGLDFYLMEVSYG
jgi:hypothetical protein